MRKYLFILLLIPLLLQGQFVMLDYTPVSHAVIPTVTTTTATAIWETIAISGGNITSDGGSAVTAKGVCWSTSSNPTTSDSYTSDGTGTGSYSSSITGLTKLTTYHYRSYATNAAGTAYGSDNTFSSIQICQGGTESVSGGYRTHVFNSTSTLTVNASINVEVLVVAGGGGSARDGGGAGGLIHNTSFAIAKGSITATVGNGGLGVYVDGYITNNGENSVFSTLTAIGGGGSGYWDGSANYGGKNGGSGGGGQSPTYPGGTATSGQGHDGGTANSYLNSPYPGCGGGGAGAIGGSPPNYSTGGSGGVGVDLSSYFGTGVGVSGWFAGGGGSGTYYSGTGGTGGTGGGANGGSGSHNGYNGTANTGGGAGGCSTGYTGGAGGSGKIIVKYIIQ